MTSTTETQGTPGPAAAAGRLEARNWGEDLVWYPRAIVDARSVDHVVEVMRDPERYPSPVRALGSRHSTAPAAEADGGTVVRMRGLDRILEIGTDTVTTEPGALYIDVAKELERRNLQFYVNIELGNLSMGSAACCATKDASLPGEYGQVSSYCVGMKLVTASGDVLEITEEGDPELMQAARSSYGMLGIVVEVTFTVRTLQTMRVEHRDFSIDEFCAALPELKDRSVMLYLFPFLDRVAVELRSYSGPAAEATTQPSHWLWRLRNKIWGSAAPGAGYLLEQYVKPPGLRYGVLNTFNRSLGMITQRALKSANTSPTDQMIRYPDTSSWKRYTFSIWAFPEELYPGVLREYFAWAKEYYRTNGWRVNLLHVGYRILQDQQALFSYTYNGTVLTIDPVSTGAPGWREFLHAYNDFCSSHGGSPLLNQSWGLTAAQVRRSFGDRVDRFEEIRRRLDPGDRLLNRYFRELLEPPAAESAEG